jgi:hypothetical protein
MLKKEILDQTKSALDTKTQIQHKKDRLDKKQENKNQEVILSNIVGNSVGNY